MVARPTYRATEADIPRIVEMGGRFVARAWEMAYDADDTAEYVRMILDQGQVFLTDHGMLGAIVTPLPFNKAHIVATELFWWCDEEAKKGEGVALFNAFEAWADEIGAHQRSASTVHEMNPGIARFYERRGYRLREQNYVRNI